MYLHVSSNIYTDTVADTLLYISDFGSTNQMIRGSHHRYTITCVLLVAAKDILPMHEKYPYPTG